MANSQFSIREGSGKRLATYTVEEPFTKHVSRMALNTSDGLEIGTEDNPIFVTGGSGGTSGSGDLPPGASTSANQTTIIGHVDGIEALLTAIDTKDGNVSTKINTISTALASPLPLPVGASTSANQTTIIGYIDGVEGLLTAIDAKNGNVSTKVDSIVGYIDGVEGLLTSIDAKSTNLSSLTNLSTKIDTLAGTVSGTRVTVSGAALTVVTLDAVNSGDTLLIPLAGAGKKLAIHRVEASNTHATTALTTGLKVTSINAGAVFGKRFLPAAGGAAVWSFPLGVVLSGINEGLNVNLSGAGTVSFTAYYEII